jgi:transcriptional regulator with XRE-family HTH domain
MGHIVVETLKRARRAKGLSLTDVAKRSGLLPEAVARAERAGTDPRFSTVAAIAKAIDTPLCELIENQPKRHGQHRRRRR